jgi:hypothetical protein
MKEKQKVKSFHIETFDGGGYFNFYTESKNNKKALKNLISNSLDFKNLANDNTDLVIKVRQIK